MKGKYCISVIAWSIELIQGLAVSIVFICLNSLKICDKDLLYGEYSVTCAISAHLLWAFKFVLLLKVVDHSCSMDVNLAKIQNAFMACLKWMNKYIL